MKTSEDMARSVICRAREHRRNRNRRLAVIGLTALGVCIFGVGVASLYGKGQRASTALSVSPTVMTVDSNPTAGTVEEQPTTVSQPVFEEGERVIFLSGSTSGSLVKLQENVSLPVRIEMIKRDLRGLSEAEKEAICKADREYADSVIAECPKEKGFCWTQNVNRNVAITTILSGHIQFRVEDRDTVDNILITTTGTGQLTNLPGSQAMDERLEEQETERPGELYAGPWEYEVNETNIRSYYCLQPYNGMGIGWMPDGRDVSIYDPAQPLSVFNDTITIIVRFKDGVVQTHVIDLVFGEDGQGSAIYRGITQT